MTVFNNPKAKTRALVSRRVVAYATTRSEVQHVFDELNAELECLSSMPIMEAYARLFMKLDAVGIYVDSPVYEDEAMSSATPSCYVSDLINKEFCVRYTDGTWHNLDCLTYLKDAADSCRMVYTAMKRCGMKLTVDDFDDCGACDADLPAYYRLPIYYEVFGELPGASPISRVEVEYEFDGDYEAAAAAADEYRNEYLKHFGFTSSTLSQYAAQSVSAAVFRFIAHEGGHVAFGRLVHTFRNVSLHTLVLLYLRFDSWSFSTAGLVRLRASINAFLSDHGFDFRVAIHFVRVSAGYMCAAITFVPIS